MSSRLHTYKKNTKKQTPHSLTAKQEGMFQPRLFVVQSQAAEKSQQPDLKTSLSRAERYGHHFDKMQPVGLSATTAIQMLPADEEEDDKLIPKRNLVNSLTANKHNPLDIVSGIASGLKSWNKHHKKQTNLEAEKTPSAQVTSTISHAADTSSLADSGKERSLALGSASSAAIKFLGTKATEEAEPLLPPDPEVDRLLNRGTKKSLAESASGHAPVVRNFMDPAAGYNKHKNAATKKVGNRTQNLAQKEAMATLNSERAFATTQRAVKKVYGVGNAESIGGKVNDRKHGVKLKNAAELVREQVTEGDRQALEHVRGTLNLDPEIVAKQGGEYLILQKVQ
ncbi:MAG: hypothetical protein ACREPR_06245 [Brasilonema sp.]